MGPGAFNVDIGVVGVALATLVLEARGVGPEEIGLRPGTGFGRFFFKAGAFCPGRRRSLG